MSTQHSHETASASEEPPTVEGSKDRAAGDEKPAVHHVPKSTRQDADFTSAEQPDRDLEGAVGQELQPVVRNLKKKVGILSPPYQDGVDNVAIAPSVSLAANQTPTSEGKYSLCEKLGYDVNHETITQKESGSTERAVPPASASPMDQERSGFEWIPHDLSGSAVEPSDVVAGSLHDGSIQQPASLITQAAGPPSEEGSPAGAVAQGLQVTACPAAQRLEGAVGRPGHSLQEPVQEGWNDQGRGRAREHEEGAIGYDGVGRVINLRRARELREADRWNIICRACWERRSEMFVNPCCHNFLCRRCFFDPHFLGLSFCPDCAKPANGLVFTKDLLDLLLRRSEMNP